MRNQSKEQFVEKMSRLYDNYNKVYDILGRYKMSDLSWYINNKGFIEEMSESRQLEFHKIWCELCDVVRELKLSTIDYITLLEAIAGISHSATELIIDCIE